MRVLMCALAATASVACGKVVVEEEPDGGECKAELEGAICSRLDKDCGQLPTLDNCGQSRLVTCGACGGDDTCGGGGVANVCGEGECTPTTCAAESADCNTISDGCGGVLTCGNCTGYDTCGGAGEDNVCGCRPTTCTAEGKNCGSLPDGCGDLLDCGTCTGDDVCGGGGPNVCGEGECVPTTCVAEGKDCDSISDNCGDILDCGSCDGLDSCGGGGEANVCGCSPTTCAAQGKNCETIPDGCGGDLYCGACGGFDECGGAGVDNVCGCSPTTCSAEGKNCETIPDGCGGDLECGGCPGDAVCGGSGVPNVCGCPPVVAVNPAAATNELYAPIFSGQKTAQSFVVPDAIDLASVRLEGNYLSAAATGTITLSIYVNEGNIPDAGTFLGSKSFVISDTGFILQTGPETGMHDFDMSSLGLTLTPQVYYWVVVEFTHQYAYLRGYTDDAGTLGEVYPAGEQLMFVSNQWVGTDYGDDLFFEIHRCL